MIRTKLVSLARIVARIGQSDAGIGARFVRGSFLTFIGRFLIRFINLARTVIVARLLFPEDFGLFGLAALAMTTTEVFTPTGFAAAIIHEKGDVGQHLNSAWTVNVLKSIILALLLCFVFAPLAGTFFENASVVPLARLLSLAILISGLENIGIILLQKELRYHRQFFYDLGGAVIQVTGLILAAYWLHSAYALAVGVIIGKTGYVILSYILHPFRPQPTLDLRGAWHLFRYGRWVALGGIISFLATRGDRLIVGKLLDPAALGYYEIAFGLGLLPAVEIAGVLGELMFPLYAKIQHDRERLRSAFLRIARVVFLIVIPATVGLAILAHPIVNLIYGARWLPMLPVLMIILVYGVIKSLHAMTNPVLLGIGQPRISTMINTLQIICMFVLFVPLTRAWGTIGTAWAVAISYAIAQGVLLLILKREINLGFRSLVTVTNLPIVASIGMYFVLKLIGGYIVISSISTLIFFVVVGIMVYAVWVLVCDRLFGGHVRESIQWIRANI